MRRLIDANKLKKYMIPLSFSCQKWLSEVDLSNASTVLTIPDNPTNGDVIKAIFPDAKITEYLDLVQVEIIVKGLNLVEIECDINWWNAPYKRGTDESSTDNRID